MIVKNRFVKLNAYILLKIASASTLNKQIECMSMEKVFKFFLTSLSTKTHTNSRKHTQAQEHTEREAIA